MFLDISRCLPASPVESETPTYFNLFTGSSFQFIRSKCWSLMIFTPHVFVSIEINFFQKKLPILTSLFRVRAPLHSQTWKWRELTNSLNLSPWICLMGLFLTQMKKSLTETDHLPWTWAEVWAATDEIGLEIKLGNPGHMWWAQGDLHFENQRWNGWYWILQPKSPGWGGRKSSPWLPVSHLTLHHREAAEGQLGDQTWLSTGHSGPSYLSKGFEMKWEGGCRGGRGVT